MQPRKTNPGVVLNDPGEFKTLEAAIENLKRMLPEWALMMDVILPVRDIEAAAGLDPGSEGAAPDTIELAEAQVSIARMALGVLAKSTDDPTKQDAALALDQDLQINQGLSKINTPER